ncbi:MAG: DNA polymerase-3 subunit delta [Flavobacterium sp.]|jgi:DNA polymerase-3 subunit delta
MDEVVKIINDIKAGNIKPIYLLMGEEPYYIDKLTEFIENAILTEDEKGFNQMVMYGRDTTMDEVISNAKRYPMMAEKQVIIVKEAQDLAKSIDLIENYASNPQTSTVLVLSHKYKSVDKRKKWLKSIQKHGVVFESKKMYENQVATWITRVLKGKGLSIEPKASAILVEFLGNDLSRIAKDLEKLELVCPKNHIINANDIEVNIGISKEYNNFELIKAIGDNNQLRAYQIADYFANNDKANPLVVTVTTLYGFFYKLFKAHIATDKSQYALAAEIGVSPYFVKDYTTAMKYYPLKKVSNAMEVLRQIDLNGKGVGATISKNDLLKELLYKIFQ